MQLQKRQENSVIADTNRAVRIYANNFCLRDREMVLNITCGLTQKYSLLLVLASRFPIVYADIVG